jgi:hypothetical protein
MDFKHDLAGSILATQAVRPAFIDLPFKTPIFLIPPVTIDGPVLYACSFAGNSGTLVLMPR